MNPIEQFAKNMQDIADRNFAEWETEVIDRVILAAESTKSKRELLGLNRKHRTAVELPLFAEKTLF